MNPGDYLMRQLKDGDLKDIELENRTTVSGKHAYVVTDGLDAGTVERVRSCFNKVRDDLPEGASFEVLTRRCELTGNEAKRVWDATKEDNDIRTLLEGVSVKVVHTPAGLIVSTTEELGPFDKITLAAAMSALIESHTDKFYRVIVQDSGSEVEIGERGAKKTLDDKDMERLHAVLSRDMDVLDVIRALESA